MNIFNKKPRYFDIADTKWGHPEAIAYWSPEHSEDAANPMEIFGWWPARTYRLGRPISIDRPDYNNH